MQNELNFFNLTSLSKGVPNKGNSELKARPEAQEEESDQSFSSVLREVSDPKAEAPGTNNDNTRSSENGPVVGKEKTAAGEEGSSRSASLSPKEPDLVEDQKLAEAAQLVLNSQVEPKVQNPSDGFPFLNSLFALDTQPVLETAAASNQQTVAPQNYVPVVQTAQDLSLIDVAQAPVQSESFVVETGPALPATAQPQNLDPLADAKAFPELDVKQAVENPASLQEKIIQTPVPLAEKKEADTALGSIDMSSVAESDNDAIDPQTLKDLKPQLDPLAQKNPAPNPITTPGVTREERNSANEKFDLFAQNQSKDPSASSALNDSRFDELIAVHKDNSFIDTEIASEAPKIASKTDSGANGLNNWIDENSSIHKLNQSIKSSEAPVSNRVLPGSLEDQVLRQIRVKLNPGMSQVDINLFPPELGSLRIHFELQGDRMKARIEAREQVTATMLERYLPELRAGMKDAGIEVKEFEIVPGHAAENFNFDQSNQSEERRHYFEKSGSSFDGENEFNLNGADGDSRELAVSRVGGGIDYLV